MPRQSKEAKSMQALAERLPPIEPPANLPVEAAEVWRELVDTWPRDFFNGKVTLLSEFCLTKALIDKLRREHRALKPPRNATDKWLARRIAEDRTRLEQRIARAQASLRSFATKLGLTNSRAKAAQRPAPAAFAPTDWLLGGEAVHGSYDEWRRRQRDDD